MLWTAVAAITLLLPVSESARAVQTYSPELSFSYVQGYNPDNPPPDCRQPGTAGCYPSAQDACRAAFPTYVGILWDDAALAICRYVNVNGSISNSIGRAIGTSQFCAAGYAPQTPTRCQITDRTQAAANLGPPCPGCGNPINPATGNKYQAEVDYAGTGPMPLRFVRSYNSKAEGAGALGPAWRHSYESVVTYAVNADSVSLRRPSGKVIIFNRQPDNSFVADADVTGRLTGTFDAFLHPLGWTYTTPQDITETYGADGKLVAATSHDGLTTTFFYDPAGRLQVVVEPSGRPLTFTYDASGRLVTMRIPGGGFVTYAYDAAGHLAAAAYPDGAVRRYHYENPAYPQALTGITDENGARMATYAYDAQGRAVLSEHAGSANRHGLSYQTDGSAAVTDPLGTTRTYQFTAPRIRIKSSAIQGAPCDRCGVAAATAYDANGFVASRTDWNGNLTTYTHDARGLETSRTEAAGTAQARTITTTWHPTFRLPIQVAEPGRTTSFTYDAQGNVLTRTLTDTASGRSRTWTFAYTYSATVPGLIEVMTVDGPRTDVSDLTTYHYYPADGAGTPPAWRRGDLWKVTNALGQVTEITAYNAHGQPTQLTDPNGLVTTLTYDARRRLTARSVGGETTTYTYDDAGQLARITFPDAAYLDYDYDAAHRLTRTTDAQGNAIAYTLDAMGNRTAERVYGAGASLVQQLTREYSSVNRLTKLIGGTNPAGQVTQYAYDAQGNLTSVTDPLNRVTANAYDALNRLVTVTDPANGVTAFGYTPLDQLASVTDPRNLVTRYTRNALDELTSQLSPDTGTTTNTFDAAGNVLASTDARGVVTSATYDALNRVTSQTFTPPGGSGIAPVAIGYGYDGGATGNGRLTSVADPSGSITFTYDAHGRLTQDARVIGGIAYPTAYRYNSAGRRDRITYPSGTVVDFSFDALGRIAGITATPAAGSASTILTGAAYHPFGALKDFTHGHGAAYSRSFDLDGRISAHTLGAGTRTITWDEASRLSAFAGPSPGLDQTMGYDALDRLTDWVSSVSSQRYSYDASGNRTRLTLGANSYPYTVSTTSNRLTHTAGPGGSKTFGFDAAGHTTAAGTLAFAYDARGRMIQAVNGSLTATYQLNALGQRVVKTLSPGATTHFHYDAEGHLIAESDAAGAVQREYLWLGDTPVALITHPDQAVYFLQPDHLNTPRVVTNAANAIVWRWDSDPFGVTPPDPDPDGDSNQFVFNLRLPGQYYDKETNTHYNMMRDYDPGIGRYIQPEPLGLAGDINLYRYARSNPLTYYDPDGAQAIPMPGLPPIGIPSPWNPKPRKSDNIFDPPAKPTGLPWPLSLLIPKSDLDKCKDECDDVLQREEADCEWRYKMGGRRDREGVRSCLQMARDRWVQCYRKCEDENRCR